MRNTFVTGHGNFEIKSRRRLIRNSIDEVLKFFAKRTRHPRAREEHHRIEGAVVQPVPLRQI
jgi:hypothetical protein